MQRGRLLMLSQCLALLGCTEGFEPASRIDGVRVLAVQTQPASGSPGKSVTATMLAFDPRDSAQPMQIAWLAGCHNPPSRQYFGCFPMLPPTSPLPELAPIPGRVGFGEQFEFAVPEDILDSAPRLVTDPIHYGVSFVFFGACAGELRLVEAPDEIPLECYEPGTDRKLGAPDFVKGFTTLFSFEGIEARNPELSQTLFAGGETSVGSCQSDADCRDVAALQGTAHEFGCGSAGSCVPLVPRCEPGSECAEYEVLPEISRDSAEADPGSRLPNGSVPRELVWARFYADLGRFQSDTQLVNDRESGWFEDHGSRWKPVSRRAGTAHLFATVHDNRGGTAWSAFEVILVDP